MQASNHQDQRRLPEMQHCRATSINGNQSSSSIHKLHLGVPRHRLGHRRRQLLKLGENVGAAAGLRRDPFLHMAGPRCNAPSAIESVGRSV